MRYKKEWLNQAKWKGIPHLIKIGGVSSKKIDQFRMEGRSEKLLQRYFPPHSDIIREKGIERVTVQGLVNDL